jgi:hypothetical protein
MRVIGEGPQLLLQPIVEFFRPLALQEGFHLRTAMEELAPVAPSGVFGIGQYHTLRIAAVPGILGGLHLLARRFGGEWR